MKKMDIIYEDKELLIINKPAKLLTIATEKEKIKTLYHEAREYIKKQNPKNKIFVVHRLDKDTSGIVIFAKNEALKIALQKNWDICAKKREYIAIVEGNVKKKCGEVVNFLKETKTLQVYDTKNAKDGKKSVTIYEVLARNSAYSLLKINLKTGRKNQIRVALSSIGHPIVGDKKYQSQKNPYGRLALHSTRLELVHPKTKKEYCFVSKIPKEWKNTFQESLTIYEKKNACESDDFQKFN